MKLFNRESAALKMCCLFFCLLTWFYFGIECVPPYGSRWFDWFFQYSFRIFGVVDAVGTITWFGTSTTVAPSATATVTWIIRITYWIKSVVNWSHPSAHPVLFRLLIVGCPPAPFIAQWIAFGNFSFCRVKSILSRNNYWNRLNTVIYLPCIHSSISSSSISLKSTQPLHLQYSFVLPQYPAGEQQWALLSSGLQIGNKPFSNFKAELLPQRGCPIFQS